MRSMPRWSAQLRDPFSRWMSLRRSGSSRCGRREADALRTLCWPHAPRDPKIQRSGRAALTIKKVDIRPGVSVLAVLRHLNYRPWFALGEFVDNAVESFTKHHVALEKADGKAVKLIVDIDVDASAPPRISIRDNAAGIFESE